MADTTEDKPNKRRLRASTPTVRGQAERVQAKQSNQRASGLRSFLGGFLWPLRKLGAAIKRLGRFRPLRILGLILVPPYFRNSWRELKQVTWPSRRESRRLTTAVVMFAVVFGAIVALVDFGLDKVFKELILK